MVDFTLTDEQKDLRELAHNFAEKEIRPVAWEYDRDGTWPQEIIEKAWEVGLMNTHIPEAYGGPGLDYLSGCLIEEELGWGCSGIGTSLMANGLASAPVLLGGSEETKKKYLGMLTEEPKLASFCLTEPDAGSDVAGMKTRAVKKGDKYVITGSKCFITNGGYADWFTVYAKTDPEAGHRGITAFVVDRRRRRRHRRQEGGQARPAGLEHRDDLLRRGRGPGREPARRGEQGLQARDDDPRPHPSGRLGAGGRHRPRRVRVRRRVLQGARPVRRPDRHAPGGRVHDRRHGDQGRGARLLVWESAVLLDQGKRNTLVSSHAKRFAADTAMEVTMDAVQVYGGYGFIKEYPVEKLMRDAKIMQLYEGTSQIQRLVIAREILVPRQVAEPQPETTTEETEASEKAAEQAPAAA